MNLFRSLLAALFAIAIANPACCCTLRKADETAAASHCCGKKEDSKVPAACSCAAKNPKQVEDPPAVPAMAGAALPPVPQAADALPAPAPSVHSAAPPDCRTDTGPPRHRLALWQRFLI